MAAPVDAIRILFVEDNPSDQDLTRRSLARSRLPHELNVVGTVAESMARLRAPEHLDVVLSDLWLPDGTGLEILAWIRKARLPLAVVLLTGSGDQEAAVAAIRAGADDYIPKRQPYLDRLAGSLQTALARYRADAAGRNRPIRVLYAEHNRFDADLTRRHFAAHARHIETVRVCDARELLAHLPAGAGDQAEYDVLLLDYHMPGMNALEAVRVVLQERGLDLPVVLVTGQGSEEVAAQALRLGVSDYVVKYPGYLFQLAPTLEKVCRQVELVREHEARRRALERVRLYEAAMKASPSAFAITDQQGVLVSVNPAYEALTGYSERELIGAPPPETLVPGEPGYRYHVLAEAASGVPWRGECNGRRRDGGRFVARHVVAPIRDGRGRVTNYVEMLEDVSALREAEIQLRHAQKMEAIGQLTGGLAHDFNNLLTVILGNAEILAARLDDRPDLHGMADIVRQAALRGATLVSRLLAFSRQQDLAPARLDLNGLVAEMLDMIRMTLGEQIRMETSLQEGLPPIRIDRGQLETALLNLILNARDAMPDGGALTIATRRAAADFDGGSGQANAVLLSVGDTGQGMPAEVAARVFEPFFTTKAPGKGTGLGLSMVYGFARQSGGDVRVSSEPGRGAVFEVLLPMADPAADVPAAFDPQAGRD